MSEQERKNTPDEQADDQSASKADMSRRALIRAGWSLPVIMAVQLPTNAFAQYAHGDTHSDAPHNDAPHNDVIHTDIHGDAPQFIQNTHTDTHSDIFHNDYNHGDTSNVPTPGSHVDYGHGDQILGVHIDHIDIIPHVDHIDIPHIDIPFFDFI